MERDRELQNRSQDRNRESNRENRGTSNRGFASMDPERQREIAAEGGRASHQGDRNRDRESKSTSSSRRISNR